MESVIGSSKERVVEPTWIEREVRVGSHVGHLDGGRRRRVVVEASALDAKHVVRDIERIYGGELVDTSLEGEGEQGVGGFWVGEGEGKLADKECEESCEGERGGFGSMVMMESWRSGWRGGRWRG